MSEEIASAAADLALVERLRRERDTLAIQVKALADQAADLTADRDHWTLAARRADLRERTVTQAYQQQQQMYTAMTERAQWAEQALQELRQTIIDMREGGHELPASLFHASFAWEEEDRHGL